MNAARLGVEQALNALRWRFPLGVLLASGLLVVAGASAETASAPARAEHRTLVGVVFGLAVPLGTWMLHQRAFGFGAMRDRLWSWARFGLSRRQLLAGNLMAICVVASATSVCAAGVGLSASAGQDTAWLSVLWLAILGTAVYVSTFSAAGMVLGRVGPTLVLLADWFLGSGESLLAIGWPRSHLRNLLGGAPPIDLAQWQSSLALGILVIMFASIAFAFAKR